MRASAVLVGVSCAVVVGSSAVLRAQGSRYPFRAAAAVLPVDSSPFQRLLDVDGDGDLDAVGTRVHQNGGNNEIRVWRNDGGVFTLAWQGVYSVGGFGGSQTNRNLAVEVGDLDGDGLQDFVVAGGAGSEKFLSRPNFTFQSVPYTAFVFGHDVWGLATGDFDGDGGLDYATAVEVSNPSEIQVQLNLATGARISTNVPFTPGSPHLVATNLVGDARPELLLSFRTNYLYGQTAMVIELQGNQLALQQSLTTSLSYIGTPYLWLAGDLDGDSDNDVVVFHPEQGTNGVPRYQIFRNQGASTLTAESEAVGGPAEYLADIDGDGDLDGVCCGGGGPIYEWPMLDFASTFEIAPNRGGGDFARAWAIPGAGSTSLAGAADVDGDGDLDLVAGRCVFYGNGPWLEEPMPKAAGGNATIVYRPWNLTDYDRDGDPDLGGGYGGFRNVGDGAMVANPNALVPPAGRSIGNGFSADVDGDGARDMVVPQSIGAVFEQMSLYRNNGGGHFTYAGAAAAPGLRIGFGFTADHRFVADVDGDGDEDLVANSNPTSDGYSSQIFWNQAGTFTPGPLFSGFQGARILCVADFDGDSRPDLLQSQGGIPVVQRNTGVPGSMFVPAWTNANVGLDFEPCAASVADVNEDGRPDIVASATIGGVSAVTLFVNVTPNGGAIAFQVSQLTGIKLRPQPSFSVAPFGTVTAGDFDGDGRTDLAVGYPQAEPNIGYVLLRQSGAGQVPTIADYQLLQQCFNDGWAADADGDGDLDLVGSFVVRGARHHGAAGGHRLQTFAGTVGEAGAAPLLGARGPFRSGENIAMLMRGIPGPTAGLLAWSLGTMELVDLPLPGMVVRIDPTLSESRVWTTAQSGAGIAASSASYAAVLPPGLFGLRFYVQSFALDPAAPSGVSCTNLVTIDVGN